MTNRPKWAEAIRSFVSDGVIAEEHGWPMEGDDPPEFDDIEHAVLDALCAAFDHEIVDDQCGIPRHRYCVYCGRRETTINERKEES